MGFTHLCTAALRASSKDGTMHRFHWWGFAVSSRCCYTYITHRAFLHWPWAITTRFVKLLHLPLATLRLFICFVFLCGKLSFCIVSDWCPSCTFQRSLENGGRQPGGQRYPSKWFPCCDIHEIVLALWNGMIRIYIILEYDQNMSKTRWNDSSCDVVIVVCTTSYSPLTTATCHILQGGARDIFSNNDSSWQNTVADKSNDDVKWNQEQGKQKEQE